MQSKSRKETQHEQRREELAENITNSCGISGVLLYGDLKKQAPNSFGGVQRLQGFASLSVLSIPKTFICHNTGDPVALAGNCVRWFPETQERYRPLKLCRTTNYGVHGIDPMVKRTRLSERRRPREVEGSARVGAGLAAARQISKISPGSILVMYTLFANEQLAKEAQAAGIQAVVSKGNGEDLLAFIRRSLPTAGRPAVKHPKDSRLNRSYAVVLNSPAESLVE